VKRLLISLLASGALLGACDWKESRTPPTPGIAAGVGKAVVLPSALAYIEPSVGFVHLVDAPGGHPRARAVQIGRNPVAWQADRAAVAGTVTDRLLALCVGEIDGPGVDPEGASLWLVPATAAAPVQYELPSRWNRITQSPNGRYVILSFQTSGPSKLVSDSVFSPNQIAVLDLNAPGAVPVVRTLRALNDVPRDFFFSPTLSLPEGPRDLLVVSSDGYVTLVDLGNSTRSEITVPLSLADDPRRLRAAQVLFDPGAPEDPSAMVPRRDPVVYLRASGSSDIIALSLTPVPVAERVVGKSDFLPSLSQLAVGIEPRDMVLYPELEPLVGQPDRKVVRMRLLVSNGSAQLVVLHLDTSRTLTIPMVHTADRILTWDGPSPDETEVRPRALLFNTKGSGKATFVDLNRLSDLKTRNLTPIDLAPVNDVLPLYNLGLVFVQHGGSQLSILNLATRTLSSLNFALSFDSIRKPPGQTGLWVVGSSADNKGRFPLPRLDPMSLSTSEARLDARADELVILPAVPGAKQWMLVAHPGADGYVTALDAATLDRASAHSLQGIVAVDLQERLTRVLPGENQ
jgi:hypothetical protein